MQCIKTSTWQGNTSYVYEVKSWHEDSCGLQGAATRRRAGPRRAVAHCRRRGKNTTPLCNGANVIMNLHLIVVPLRSDVTMCYEFLISFSR